MRYDDIQKRRSLRRLRPSWSPSMPTNASSKRLLRLLVLVSCCPLRSKTNPTVVSAAGTPWASGTTQSMNTEPNTFRGLSDNSALARTMVGGGGAGLGGSWDPYLLEAPGADQPLRLSHGTTTVALIFNEGVVAAVDSRASMGSFVGSSTTQKVIPVSDHILGTMAGGAADCTFWLRYLGMQAKIFEARNGRPMSVATAARVLADTLIGQRGRGLSVGTMVMGHDPGHNGGSQLYYVDSEGSRVKGRYFSVGSGSTYAYSVLDEGYRPDMSLKEAADLARRAVRHATYRDAFSGGVINVFVVNASGWSRITADDAGFMGLREHDEHENAEHEKRDHGESAETADRTVNISVGEEGRLQHESDVDEGEGEHQHGNGEEDA